MSLSVSKLSPELVVPSAATPSGTLRLGWLDRYPTQRGLIGSLHVFKQGREPAAAIKVALSKALVFYYPFAGRLVVVDGGELQVDCTADGVWFVEASADCSLEAVGRLESPPVSAEDELLPHPIQGVEPFEESKHLLMLQVTTFTCGGFVVGLRSNHAIADGLGAGQLLVAIAEMARGLETPTIAPIWCRELIPEPLKKPILGPPPALENLDLQDLIVDVSPDSINRMKRQFTAETDQRCSSFDVLIAKVWQSRTKAMDLDPEANVRLCFPVNTRHLFKDVLPSKGLGFYGNCFYNMKVSAPSEQIAHGSIAEVVKLIKAAKEATPAEFSRFMKGELLKDPYVEMPSYEFLAVSDWSRLGFNEVDYGWGPPIHVIPPLTMVFNIPLCLVVKPPIPKQGVRLITKFVKKEHLEEFSNRMMNLD